MCLQLFIQNSFNYILVWTKFISFVALGAFSFSAFSVSLNSLALAKVQIDVGAPGGTDDYLCWGLAPAQVTWIGPGPAPSSVQITARSSSGISNTGKVAFSLSRNTTGGLSDRVTVALDAASGKGTFFVAGTTASREDKDITIFAEGSGNAVLGEQKVMVRVRKNAETLSELERDRFLQAFVDAATRNNQFAKYWGVHTDAINMAHQVAFLPWHRVFLLNLERELQREDASVALPYWKFDQKAPKLFSKDFIGRVGGLANPQEVEFSATNPMSGFRLTDPRVAPLTRNRNGDTLVSPFINKNFMNETSHILMNSEIFGPFHGEAHVHIGGLIGDIRRSPADALFFMLHANVDRAWAAWQRIRDRFDRASQNSYGLQGAHSSTSTVIKGNFVDDTMWPWDNDPRPSEPITITIGRIELPPKIGPSAGATINPIVGDMIDYLDQAMDGGVHNYCYDNVPIGVGPVADFP